jgi:hypothetical protein
MKNTDEDRKFPEHRLFSAWSYESANKSVRELKAGISMYLIAKIWQHAQSWNEKVVSQFKAPVSVFVPHQHNPYNTSAQSFKHCVHDVDLEAICKSQGAILLPPYGNDCSYEVGVYKMLNVVYGKGRIIFPVIAIVREDVAFLKDWMVKAGITHVVTDSSKTFETIKSDPMLGSSNRNIIKIDELSELNDIVIDIMLKVRGQEKIPTTNAAEMFELATRKHIPLTASANK